MKKSAFRLRKATVEDFQDFYNFHVHYCYQWLFNDELATEEDDPFHVTFEGNYFCSKEDLERMHNELINFDITMFEKYLQWYRIFMIEVGGKVVGYVKLENYCKQFIVRGWRMHYEYMDEELLGALLEKFETYAPLKAEVIEVISFGGEFPDNFLKSHGYTLDVHPFYKKLNKKTEV